MRANPPIVSVSFSVAFDGAITSDVQTHGNSYAEVARGLAAIRAELDRVFREQSKCPFHPKTTEDAHRKIPRN